MRQTSWMPLTSTVTVSNKFLEAHSLRVKSTAEAMEAPNEALFDVLVVIIYVDAHEDACGITP